MLTTPLSLLSKPVSPVRCIAVAKVMPKLIAALFFARNCKNVLLINS